MLRLKDENGVYGFHFSMTLTCIVGLWYCDIILNKNANAHGETRSVLVIIW